MKTEIEDRCPCGGIILADTEDCTTVLCHDCAYEIAEVMLKKDENYNEGFMKGRESVLNQFPSEEEINHHIKLCQLNESNSYIYKKGIEYGKSRLMGDNE